VKFVLFWSIGGFLPKTVEDTWTLLEWVAREHFGV